MTYQELQNILKIRQASPMGYTPSLEDIISGIQSQYQPEQQQFTPPAQSFQYQQPSQLLPTTQQIPGYNLLPTASFGQGAQRFVTQGSFADQETPFVEFGRQVQPSFTRGAFNIADYKTPSTSELIDTIGGSSNLFLGGGNGGDGGSTTGPSVDSDGMATNTNVSPAAVTAMAMSLSAMTGLPVGLAASLIGKQNIANTINAQSAAQAAAQNQATVAAMMGIQNTPENQITIQQAIDSITAINAQANPAISAAQAAQGVPGVTGAAVGAAGVTAADAAAAVGHSDAAIGAAAQAAADATAAGASPAAAAAAAADAANAAAADAADAEGSGVGTAASAAAADAAAAAASDAAAAAGADAADADGGGVGTAASADSSGGGGGGGGGGGKIICTKLYELGLMPKNIYDADQAFGKKLVNDSPETYYGYVRWAKNIVDLMSRNDLLGKAAIFCAYHIATPWSLAMAEEMGQPVKSSWFGKFLMKRGLQFCKLIGSGNKQTAIA